MQGALENMSNVITVLSKNDLLGLVPGLDLSGVRAFSGSKADRILLVRMALFTIIFDVHIMIETNQLPEPKVDKELFSQVIGDPWELGFQALAQVTDQSRPPGRAGRFSLPQIQWLPCRTLGNEALGSWFSEHV
jgi:hypothetical protein